MSKSQAGQVDTVMQEVRVFPPSPEFAEKARIKSLAHYEAMWKQAAADIEAFWGGEAAAIHWFEPFTKVLEWNEPFASWFVGGKTNASYNCLDAHLNSATAKQSGHHLGRRARRRAARSPISNCTTKCANSPTC